MFFIKKLKKFYQISPENRLQIRLIVAFSIIPIIGLIILYFIAISFVSPSIS